MQFFLLVLMFLLSSSATAQVGGETTFLHQFDGVVERGEFGKSVAAAGDVDGDGIVDFIIGACNPNINQQGSAFVYSGATWLQLHHLQDPAAGSTDLDRFGWDVDGGVDFDGDGFDDLLVGAPWAESALGSSRAGRVLVFSGASGALLFSFEGADVFDELGTSVSALGDVDADGVPDFLFGAPGIGAGVVFVHSGADGSLIHRLDALSYDDGFGKAVADAGDVDGDGVSDFLVGAPDANSIHSFAGSAFLYSGTTAALLYRYDGDGGGQHLGTSVAGAGDLDADGYADFLIGVPEASPGGLAEAGSVLVYSGFDGSLLFRCDGEKPGSLMGVAVASLGDTLGDGTPDLLLGASGYHDAGVLGLGAVYLYSGATATPFARLVGASSGDRLGNSVAGVGDLDGDGTMEFLAAAHRAEPGGLFRAGSVHVVDFEPLIGTNTYTMSAAGGGVLDLDLDFPDAAAFDEYKILVSASGTGPTFYGVEIPLTRDDLARSSFFGSYPFPAYSNLQGVLDASGDAVADITFPAGLPAGYVGRTLWFAALANPPGALPEYSSIAVPLEIVP